MIIIDNIDVSNCPFLLKATKIRCTRPNLSMNNWLCEENPHCKYKRGEKFSKEDENILNKRRLGF